jgi:hypothetical protein
MKYDFFLISSKYTDKLKKFFLQFYPKYVLLDKKVYESNPPQFPFCKSFAVFIETDLIKNVVARHALDIYDKTFFS